MKDRAQRMQEFVEYHIHGDGECNNVVLKQWVNEKKLTLQERYIMAFLFSVTYCVESAIILFEKQRNEGGLYIPQLKELKQHIVFQSDRKYMKMKDNFERTIDDFKNHDDVTYFLRMVSDGDLIDLKKAIKYVSTWVMYGRFASFLFLETFVELTDFNIENTTIEWKKGDTATSGLLNLFTYDNHADVFDKTGKLYISEHQLDRMLFETQKHIAKAGGATNVTEVETSLCAYRKLYKGTRYNGFYLDRMLEEIYSMSGEYPEISQDLIRIRKMKIDHKYLGEVGGWRGIRKNMKKLYKNTGIIT